VEDYRVTIGVALSVIPLGNHIYQFEVINATPGGLVTFLYGQNPGNLFLPAYGVTVGVTDPTFFAQGIAGSNGTATAIFVAPPGLQGVTLYFDAFEQAPNAQANPDLLSFAPLRAADGQGAGSEDIDGSQLQPIIDEAIQRWSEAGLSSEQVQLLGTVAFTIADLPDARLAHTYQATVVVDCDGAGHGWYVDPTPGSDEEFTQYEGGTELSSVEGPTAGQMDLLTAIMHEMGHVLDLPDTATQPAGNTLMAESLAVGTRRLPDLAAVKWSDEGDVALVAAAQAGQADVIVSGTAGNDSLRFQPGAPYHTILVNDARYTVAAASVGEVPIDGQLGQDSVALVDSQGDDEAHLYPTYASIEGPGYRANVTGAERTRVYANRNGNDQVFLHDGPGNDRLVARPEWVKLWGAGFDNLAAGFEKINVVSESANDIDRAFFRDSGNNPIDKDTFDGLVDYALSIEDDWLY
jgi:hypothetical protein